MIRIFSIICLPICHKYYPGHKKYHNECVSSFKSVINVSRRQDLLKATFLWHPVSYPGIASMVTLFLFFVFTSFSLVFGSCLSFRVSVSIPFLIPLVLVSPFFSIDQMLSCLIHDPFYKSLVFYILQINVAPIVLLFIKICEELHSLYPRCSFSSPTGRSTSCASVCVVGSLGW